MSDATHLTNFSGDKKAHPIYLTIGNISTEIRAKPTYRALQPLALLPIAPKRPDKMGEAAWRLMKDQIRRVRDEALSVILEDLTVPALMDGMYAFCGDGEYRSCYLRVAAWVADYPEHIDLQGLQSFRCPWCEVKQEHLHRHTDEFRGRLPNFRDYRIYKTTVQKASLSEPQRGPRESLTDFKERQAIYRAEKDEYHGILHEAGVNITHSPLWDLYDCDVSTLPKPDKLHTIYLGLVDHLMKWLTDMLHRYGRLDRFQALSRRVPAYLDMSAIQKSWQEVCQWTGKESKRQIRYLYAVLAATLTEPPAKVNEKRHFNDALHATRALVEVCLYLDYRSHTDDTIALLERAIRLFFVKKETFRPYRAGKNARGDARDKRTNVIIERDEDLARLAREGATPRELNVRRTYWNEIIRQEMDDVLVDGAHFNLPKLHMLLHFTDNVRMFGNMGQFDSGMSEAAHKEFKKGYRASNRVGQWMKQILNRTVRLDAFALRENWQKTNEIGDKEYDSDADPSEPSRIKFDKPPGPPNFIGIRKDLGKRGITTMFEVIEMSQIPGFLEAYVKWVRKHVNPRFSDNDHLRAPAAMYNQMEIYVEAHASAEWERQRMRCTPGSSWYGNKNRADWAWIRVNEDSRGGRRTGRPTVSSSLHALHGRVPVRLQCLFRVSLFNDRGENHVFSLVLAEVPMAVNGGRTSDQHHLVTLRRPDLLLTGTSRNAVNAFRGNLNERGQNLLVLGAHAVDGAAHCVPLQHEGVETSWLVNPHIDLRTWNIVYDSVDYEDA